MKRVGIHKLFLAICAVCVLSGCKDDSPTVQPDNSYDWSRHVPFEVSYMAEFLPFNAGYETEPTVMGALELDESSGIAASINNEGMFWTHEDSGNGNIIYLVDGTTAEIVCSYRVNGSTNRDWEDMEIIKDPDSGEAYLYISDTGDNEQRHSSSSVYRVKEPVYTAGDYGRTININADHVERYTFAYPDGSRDVESMFVDPETKDIYFVTKRDVVSRVYIMPYPYQVGAGNQVFLVGELGFREASAASMNFGGDKLIIRNRQNLFYWERNTNENTWEMLKRTPERLPYQGEVQGEAVCFDQQDNYYTTSERADLPPYPPLYKYTKK